MRLASLSLIGVLISATAHAEELRFPLMTLVKTTRASSTLIERTPSRFAYHPTNLFDENPATAWFEGVSRGKGEFVEFEFFTRVDLVSMTIRNGYGKSTDLFRKNGRVKQLEVSAGNSRQTLTLADRSEEQPFPLGLTNIERLRISIVDIYHGSQHKDIGLSEVSVEAHLHNDSASVPSEAEVEELYQELQSSELGKAARVRLGRLAPIQLAELLARPYEGLDGAGNDERLYGVLHVVLENPALIPVVLKAVYERRQEGLFRSESSREDPYAGAADRLWDGRPSAVPLIWRSGTGAYSSLYRLLLAGDTRAVPDYLKVLRETGIWHEFCCELMPHELLQRNVDAYTLTQVQSSLQTQELSSSVRGELEKVAAGAVGPASTGRPNPQE